MMERVIKLSQVPATESDLWETRALPGGVTLELCGGGTPVLILVQGENRVGIELADVKEAVAALTDAAVDLVGLLATGGVYHA
jgi:hypothetical protein